MELSPVLVFWLALAVVQGKVNWEKYFAKCKEETGAEETIEEVIRNEEIPTTGKGTCLIECLMRAISAYDQYGNFNEEGARKHLEELFEEKPPEVIEKAASIASECSKTDITGLNRCEAAAKHWACGNDKFKQQNIIVNKD